MPCRARNPDQLTYGEVSLSVVSSDATTSVHESVQSLRVAWSPPVSNHGSRVDNYTIEWYSQAGRHEIQEVIVAHDATPIEGTFALKYGDARTDLLRHDFSADEMTKAIEGLATIRNAQVTRVATPSWANTLSAPAFPHGFLWRITFNSDSAPFPKQLEILTEAAGIGANLTAGTLADTKSGMKIVLAGTLSATQGSTTVTTTQDLSAVLPSQDYSFVQIGDHARDIYEVTASSTTSLTLASPFRGSSFATYQGSTGTAVPGRTAEKLGSHVYVPTAAETAPYSYVIRKLTNAIPYHVKVSAHNERGLSTPQDTVPASLAPPAQKPSEPLDAELATHTSTSLRAYWFHPKSNGGAAVTTYRIEWDTASTFDSGAASSVLGHHELTVDSATACTDSPCNHVIGSLSKGVRYFVRVYAYNSFGYSVTAAYPRPLSEIPKTQPAPPARVDLEAFDETGLAVRFDASPDDGGATVTKYKVEWDAVDQAGYDATGTSASLLYAHSEIQVIKTVADANDLKGTFRVGFETEYTGDIDVLASADDVKQALEQLPTVGVVDVRRRENNPTYIGNGHEWIVTFRTNYGNVAAMQVSTNNAYPWTFGATAAAGQSLVGTNAGVSVLTTVNGLDGFEQQTITISAGANDTAGHFTLTYDTAGQTTAPLGFNSSALAVKTALEELKPGPGKVHVYREIYQGFGHRWTIVFLERLGNLPTLKCNYEASLKGSSVLCIGDELSPGARCAMDSGLKGEAIVDSAGRSRFTHVIPNLDSRIRYHVRVSAWNGVGEVYGNTQYSIPATLSPSRAPDAPSTVRANTVNATAVNISWSLPVNEGGVSSPIHSYKVEWDGSMGKAEQQALVVSGATTGTFTLSLGGQTTQVLEHDLTAPDLKLALEAISTIGTVDVQRTLVETVLNSEAEATQTLRWDITFSSNVGDVEQMTVDGTLLSGYSKAYPATATVSTAVEGTRPGFDQGTRGIQVSSLGSSTVSAVAEVQTITTSATADDLAGQFWVTFMGHTSEPIRFDASSFDMQRALEGIKTCGEVIVRRRDENPYDESEEWPYTPVDHIAPRATHGKSWDVTFKATQGDVPSLLVSTKSPVQGLANGVMASGGLTGVSGDISSGLRGTSASVRVTESVKGVAAPRHLVVAGLNTAGPLNLRVSAHNDRGASTVRLSTFSIEPKNQPPSAPSTVYIHAVSDTRASVTWRPPVPGQNGGHPVTKYSVQWTENSQFTGQVLSVILDVSESRVAQGDDGAVGTGGGIGEDHYAYIITGLTPGSRIYARIMAYNKLGYGPPAVAAPVESDLLEIQTVSIRAADNRPAPQGSFKLTFDSLETAAIPMSATAPQVQEALQALDNVGTVNVKRYDLTDSYDTTQIGTTQGLALDWVVTFTSNSGCRDSVKNRGSTIPTLLVTSVDHDAGQTGTVPAFPAVTVVQEGAASDGHGQQHYVVVRDRVPSGPDKVRLSIVSKDALGVSWEAPRESGGQTVDKYLIEWDELYEFRIGNTYTPAYSHVIKHGDNGWPNPLTATPPTIRYKIGEGGPDAHSLTSGQQYFVRVSAHTSAGWGPAVVADPVSREGAVLNFTAPDHPYQWDPRHQSPVAQIPYLPDKVQIDVSETNIPDQIDIRWTRPTVNILGFDYNAAIDHVDFYRLEFDPAETFDSYTGNDVVRKDGPHGYYDIPNLQAGACTQTNDTSTMCSHALGREVQTVTVTWSGTGKPTAGSYTLEFKHTNNGYGVDGVAATDTTPLTECLSYDLSAQHLEDALLRLSSVGNTKNPPPVRVTRRELPNEAPGNRGHVYSITFSGFAVQGNVPSFVVKQPGVAVAGVGGGGTCANWAGANSAFPMVAHSTVHEGGQLTAGTKYWVRVRAIVSAAGAQQLHPELGGGARWPRGVGNTHSNLNGMGEPRSADTKWEIPRAPPLKPVDVGGYALRAQKDSYHVVWTHPITNNGAAITHWKIQYTQAADTTYAQLSTAVDPNGKPCRNGAFYGQGPDHGFVDTADGVGPYDITVSEPQGSAGCTGKVIEHVFLANQGGPVFEPGGNHVKPLAIAHGMAHRRPDSDYYWNIPNMPTGDFLNLRVFAYNDQGYSLPMAVEARCEPDVEDCTAENRARALPGLPGGVTLSAPANDNEFTRSSLLVSWDHGALGGIANTKYKIEWDTVPTFDTRQGRPLSYEFSSLGTSPEVQANTVYRAGTAFERLHYNITGLDQGVNIFVRVTSHNSLGYSMSGCGVDTIGTVNCAVSVVTPSATHAAKPMEPPGLVHPIGPTNVKLKLLDASENHRLKGTALDVEMYPPVSDGGDNVQRYRVEWTTDANFGDEAIRLLRTHHDANGNGDKLNGYFRITYDTRNCTTCQVRRLHQTGRLAHDVSAWDLQTALHDMENVAQVVVLNRTQISINEEFSWRIIFKGDVGPLPALQFVTDDLSFARSGSNGGAVTETVEKVATTPTDYCGSYANNPTKCPEVTDNLGASPVKYRITGLVPGTQYRVRVAAYNVLGYGPTRVTTPPVLTPPKQPPSAPTNPFHRGPGVPVLKPTSPSSLTVRFGPPDFDGGDPILKYKIEWDTKTSFDSAPGDTKLPVGMIEVVGGQANEYIIDGLVTGTRYYVRVFAYNTAGRFGDVALTSPRSEVPRSSPGLPSLVSLEVSSPTSLKASFSPASPSGDAIAKYRVHRFTRSPVYPHFGVEEVQQIKLENAAGDPGVDGSFTLAFGSLDKPLPGNVSVIQNKQELGTSSDLTEQIARGDAIRVGTYTYNVHRDGMDFTQTADYIFEVSTNVTYDTFNEQVLSLERPYPGATSQDNHGDVGKTSAATYVDDCVPASHNDQPSLECVRGGGKECAGDAAVFW